MFTDMLLAIVDRIKHTAHRPALLNDDGPCDFGTLGARCQGFIDALDSAPDGVVLIYGHKEVDAVAAMLACALIRRPFVFVDTANPAPRIAQIEQTAQAGVLVCSQPLPGHVDGLILETRSIPSRSLTSIGFKKPDRGLFYIAFTSGSTGTPKGVQIGYDNFGLFYGWYSPLLQHCRGIGAHVNHASFSFDMGMADLWPALALGKPVMLLNHRHNPFPRANLRTLTCCPGVVAGSWFSTPTFLALMCTEPSFRESTLPQLRTFFVGGEPVPRLLLIKLMERFPRAEIWHAYGPTEVTCVTHCRRLTTSDLEGSGPLPLGRAIPPNEVRIVDEDGREMAAGEVGEIELAGPQVAHGYLPQTHPQNTLFRIRDNKRFYRTGDYGTVDREGNLTLSGRVDGQVKWNGHRIEIGEIERVAQDALGVRQAVVVPLSRDNRVVDLTLFVRLREDDDCERAAFLSHLTGALPAYMRPRSIRFVDHLPVTLHGKVDRTRLSRSFFENRTLQVSDIPP
jgi:D-alanine--poly(phosphoribitol) ligase subunit 1